jgi:glycerate kinase
MSRRVLVAFDKFKDALTAERACAITAREIRRAHPDWTIDLAPLTDGGEGFCRILTESVTGRVETLVASGPRMESLHAPLGLVDPRRLPVKARGLLFGHDSPPRPEQLAVIEMAAINGLALLPPDARDPWSTSSFGTGQLIRAAAEMGAGFVLLGVGGSATSDLGLGALAALGMEFRDSDGAKIRPPFPALWDRVARIEGAVFASIPPIAIACDVSNPLLGSEGAAAVYGPQKGLKPEDLPRLDGLASTLAHQLCRHCGKDPETTVAIPGTGAAGGISFGLMTAAGARLVPGFELVTAWLDLEARIAAADLVVTGEGRFDRSSLSGKGPGAIVQRARAAGRETLVFAGAVEAGVENHGESGSVLAITPPGTPLPEALARADRYLAAAVSARLS